jgi:hypothetical protein
MQGAFWIVYCIIDMTTDVSIIMLSINLVAYLKIRLSSKIAVVGCFAPRILVIGASLARLVYLYPITPHDSPAFELWIPTVCTQAQVCLAIVTACIPFMRPLFLGKESSAWKPERSTRKRAALGVESSYGCCSYSYLKGHKRGQNSSVDSSAFTVSKTWKTPDVSPRIPTPRRLSPLTPPRLRTPSTSSADYTRRPSDSGLRLHIPPPEIHVRRATQVDITSPQTASSNALSPECLSPQPLLSPPQAYSPTSPRSREPSPPPPSHNSDSIASNHARSHRHSESTGNFGTSPPRFSLFPQTRTPRYSRLSQQFPNPALSVISERSRSGGRTPASRISPNGTPETRTPSPNARIPVSPPTHSTPRFSRVLYDDPLRTKGTAITTSTPVPAPITMTTPPGVAPFSSLYQTHSSIPSHYVTTPPTAHTSDPSSLQTLPSYYTRTPPTSRPPTFTVPAPPAPHPSEPAPAPGFNQPTSPQRQRNRRILTPQNTSRALEKSPVSPPTPISFWREDDDVGDSAARKRQQEEARVVEIVRVRDVRSSPRIVEQRYS